MFGNGKPNPRVSYYTDPVAIAILMVVIIAVGCCYYRRGAVCHCGQSLSQIAGEMRLEMFHSTARLWAHGCRVTFR